MTILWSEVQLTYIFIMTIFLGIFRPIGIGLHSRVLHTPQSAHSALVPMVLQWLFRQSTIGFTKLCQTLNLMMRNRFVEKFRRERVSEEKLWQPTSCRKPGSGGHIRCIDLQKISPLHQPPRMRISNTKELPT